MTETARDAGENVGSYATHATASGATLANYNVTSNAGSLSITTLNATVTAGSGTKIYGAVDPTLDADPGFLAGITVTQTARDAGENIGSYATHATATGATLANYNVTYNAGSLSVTTLNATVTAGSGTKIYGAVDPTHATRPRLPRRITVTETAVRCRGECGGCRDPRDCRRRDHELHRDP